MKTANPVRVKKSGLRAINQGTRYDIAGQLRRAARSIEKGEDVRDVIFISRTFIKGSTDNFGQQIECYHWGTGELGIAHWMLSTAKNRIEPA